MKYMRTLSGMTMVVAVSVRWAVAFNPIPLIPVEAQVGINQGAASATGTSQSSMAAGDGSVHHVDANGRIITSAQTQVNSGGGHIEEGDSGKILEEPMGFSIEQQSGASVITVGNGSGSSGKGGSTTQENPEIDGAVLMPYGN